jgi:virginiamycin B lyase
MAAPWGIAVGSDGALWCTDRADDSIGRITTRGKLTVFKQASLNLPSGITAGPNGALWFANSDSIGRITTRGKMTFFKNVGVRSPTQVIETNGIAAGPDGAIWFTNLDASRRQKDPLSADDSIVRISTHGNSTLFRDPGLDGPSQ